MTHNQSNTSLLVIIVFCIAIAMLVSTFTGEYRFNYCMQHGDVAAGMEQLLNTCEARTGYALTSPQPN